MEPDIERKFETKEDDQLAQKCMRCGESLLISERTTRDPQWRNCVSHAACVPEDEQMRYAAWLARKKPG